MLPDFPSLFLAQTKIILFCGQEELGLASGALEVKIELGLRERWSCILSRPGITDTEHTVPMSIEGLIESCPQVWGNGQYYYHQLQQSVAS